MENRKFSFFTKKFVECPVCSEKVYKEEMLTGRGRLSAKDLTSELRREYHPIPSLGHITPVMYSVTTCPICLFSLINSDWKNIELEENSREILAKQTTTRKNIILSLFKQEISFADPKDQLTAAASYYLTLSCYPFVPNKFSPALKCATSALRFSWMLDDLIDLNSNIEYWQDIKKQMQIKIYNYFDIAYTKALNQEEPLEFFGPDTDRNNGFDGLVYLHHYFKLKVTPKDNIILMEQTLTEIKRDLSRIFGLGKSSKSRPVAILNLVRKLYDYARNELEKIAPNSDDDE